MIRFLYFLFSLAVVLLCNACSPKCYVVVSGDASAVVDRSSGRRAVSVSLRIVSSARLDSLSVSTGDSLSLP